MLPQEVREALWPMIAPGQELLPAPREAAEIVREMREVRAVWPPYRGLQVAFGGQQSDESMRIFGDGIRRYSIAAVLP